MPLFLISVLLATIILLVITSRVSQEKLRLSYCNFQGFIYDLNLIAPTQLGVNRWQVGDYAHYRYRRKQTPDSDRLLHDREVDFHIISELEKAGVHGFWLKKTGFYFPETKEIPTDIYRWVTVHDLRVTPKNPSYEDPLNYFPFLSMDCEQTDVPLAKLVKLGKEKIKTEAGTFECIRYRAELDHNNRYIEIWAFPIISPLGIVRVQSDTETLELISFGRDTEITVPKSIQPVIEGVSTLKDGCNSCHGANCHEMFFPPK